MYNFEVLLLYVSGMIMCNGTYTCNIKRTLLQVQQLVHFAEINPKHLIQTLYNQKSKLKDDLILRTCSFWKKYYFLYSIPGAVVVMIVRV